MFPHNSFLKRTLPVFVQCASVQRKPRWLPVAKSKIYRIPKRPVVPEEEKRELQRINNNYNTQMRALKRFYNEERVREESSLQSASSEMSQKVEAEEWERVVALNEQWNSKVAAEREVRREKQLAAMEERVLAHMEAKDREVHARLEKASEEIRIQKELCATFITPETLDAAIDAAIDNVTDYNYAIDLKGNRYEGRETQSLAQENKKRVEASA